MVGLAKGAGLLGPIAAAGAASLFNSQDAEAAVTLRLLREAPEAYNALRKQLARDRQKGLSPMRTAEKFIHDQSMTNYDKGFNSYARKVDGTTSGDYWKSGVQGLYDEIIGAVDDPDPMVVEAMDAWLESHLGREAGATMAQNRAKARAARAAGAGAAATAATGAATAGESPALGWGEWPTQDQPIPTSPAERGFAPWSDYEPQPSYLDRVTDPATYANALRPYAQGLSNLAQSPVGQYIGQRGSELMEEYDSAGGFARGVGRGVYGLLSGESPSQAYGAGVGVSNMSAEESGQAVQQWATDRGWHPDDAAAAGTATEWLTNPLDYMGLGLFGKAAKVAG